MTIEKAMIFYCLMGLLIILFTGFIFYWNKRNHLIDNWKKLFKFHSTKVVIAMGLLPEAWMQLPPEWKADIPSSWMRTLSVVLVFAFFAARTKAQGSKQESQDSSLPTPSKNPPELK